MNFSHAITGINMWKTCGFLQAILHASDPVVKTFNMWKTCGFLQAFLHASDPVLKTFKFCPFVTFFQINATVQISVLAQINTSLFEELLIKSDITK